MTLDELLVCLDNPQQRGRRWAAKCPAHPDKSPSLSVSEGERGLLVRCWAGCSLSDICAALGLDQRALFYDHHETDPAKRKVAAQERERRRREQDERARKQGRRIDALKAADAFAQSRRGLDIGGWSDAQLDAELNVLADAYRLLEMEGDPNG